MNGLTNATSQDTAWCPKTPDSKIGVVGSTSLPEKELGSQKTWVFISLHRLQIRHSKILLILVRPLPIGYFTLYYFSFFLILTGWMRGALCVVTRLYILYLAADESISGWEFLLLIPKSPQGITPLQRCSRCILQPQPTVLTIVVGVYLFTICFVNGWSFYTELKCESEPCEPYKM